MCESIFIFYFLEIFRYLFLFQLCLGMGTQWAFSMWRYLPFWFCFPSLVISFIFFCLFKINCVRFILFLTIFLFLSTYLFCSWITLLSKYFSEVGFFSFKLLHFLIPKSFRSFFRFFTKHSALDCRYQLSSFLKDRLFFFPYFLFVVLGDFSEKKELEIPLPQNFENNLFHSIGAQGVKKEVTLSHDYFFTSMIAQSFMIL